MGNAVATGGFEFNWKIWLFEAKLGAKLSSGFRFLPKDNVHVVTVRRINSNNSWSSFGVEIALKNASRI